MTYTSVVNPDLMGKYIIWTNLDPYFDLRKRILKVCIRHHSPTEHIKERGGSHSLDFDPLRIYVLIRRYISVCSTCTVYKSIIGMI